MDLEFTDLAKQDLASIEKYTRERWGELQADAYLALIEQQIHNLLNNPKIGRKRPDIAENCQYYPSNEHLIFYRTEPDEITILAIPHAKMDLTQHLEPDSSDKS